MTTDLKKQRLALGLTQAQVATLVGCSRGHISIVERGKSLPRKAMLARIERVLGLRESETTTTDQQKLLHERWCRDFAPERKIVTHDMY